MDRGAAAEAIAASNDEGLEAAASKAASQTAGNAASDVDSNEEAFDLGAELEDVGEAEKLLDADLATRITSACRVPQQASKCESYAGAFNQQCDNQVNDETSRSHKIGVSGLVISDGRKPEGGGNEFEHGGTGSGESVDEDESANYSMHPSLLEVFMSHPVLVSKVQSPRNHMNQTNLKILDRTIKSLAMPVISGKRKRSASGEHPPFERKYAYVGRGGFGTAILVQSTQNGNSSTNIYKLEFSDAGERSQDLPLSREHRLYSLFSSGASCTNGKQTPLPKLGNTLAGHAFVTIFLSDQTTVRILDMEKLSDWPQKHLARSSELFSREYRIDSAGHEVIMKISDAILFLEGEGIQHNDLKRTHIFARGSNVVFIDYGLAQTKSLTYEIKHRTQTGRVLQGSPGTHTFDLPSFSKETPLRIIGASNGKVGTPGSRPPERYPGNHLDDNVNNNLFQFGMLLLEVICPHLFDKVGSADPASERFAESNSQLSRTQFQAAVCKSVVDARTRKVSGSARCSRRAGQALMMAVDAIQLHSPFGEDIVDLCQGLLNGDVAKVSQVYASAFARRYIPTCMEWFNRLCAEGLVVLPYAGVQKPSVIVWDKERGFELLNLFSFDVGDIVVHYLGRQRPPIQPTARPTRHSYSCHSVKLSDSIVDGTPDGTLSIDLMAKYAAAGALVGSSRQQPNTQCKPMANLKHPGGKQFNVYSTRGDEFLAIEMRGSKATPFGSVTMWDYDWAAMGRGIDIAVTQEQIDEAIKIRQSMPCHWWNIIRARRQEYWEKGYRDSYFRNSCSIRTCCCNQNSIKEARVFQFDQVEDTAQCLQACGSLGVAKSRDEYWEMPADMESDARQRATVETNFINSITGAVDVAKREEARRDMRNKLDVMGLVILQNFYGSWEDGKRFYCEAKAKAEAMHFPNVVSLNVPTKAGKADPSDRTKTMTNGIKDQAHPVYRALGLVAEHYLPGMVVSEGENVCKGATISECAVLKQAEVEHDDTLRRNGVAATVHQILHTDKEMFTDVGKSHDLENLNRRNLAFFMNKEGPLSIWAPLVDADKILSLVGYLGSHRPALALWVFMARHYRKMKEAYQHGKNGNDDEFLKVWIGAARLFMRREYPDDSDRMVAERIPATRHDVFIVHGLYVHGGTDEVGLRMFAGYSPAGFHHISNVIHTVPDSPVLAAMFDTVLQPLLVKHVPLSDDEEPSRRRARRS